MTISADDEILRAINEAFFDGSPKGQRKWIESASGLAELFGCSPDQIKIKRTAPPQMNLINRINETTTRTEVRYPVAVCSNQFDFDDLGTIQDLKNHLRIPGREAVLIFGQGTGADQNYVSPRRLVALEHSPIVGRVKRRWPSIQIDLVADKRSIRKSIQDVALEQQKFGQGIGEEDPTERRRLLKVATENLHTRIVQLDLPFHVKLTANTGQGNPSLVPYIRIFDAGKSKNASTGFYVCVFIKGDGKRVHLSIQQPATNGHSDNFGQKDRDKLDEASENHLRVLHDRPGLSDQLTAIQADRLLDLRDQNGNIGPKAKNYDVSNICSIGYDPDNLPCDSDLIDHVSTFLQAADHLNQIVPLGADDESDEINEVAAALYWPESRVHAMLDSLTDASPQIVLAGPPGTGKTYAARLIASTMLGVPGAINDERITLVQFHPTFGYEDFVEGLRPVGMDGAVVFESVPGPIVRLARKIREDGAPRVLIIDEINRANVPRVFGELMYLLEYRNHSIDLMLQPGFALPQQLYIIATMNTADKSTRVMDAALRRRFDFFTLNPDVGILRGHYDGEAENDLGEELFDGFEKLNKKLEEDLDKHRLIGHSYFIADRFSLETLRARWERQIAPLLEEYFYERQVSANGYRIEEFWPSAAS
jgi:hypothetical protein